MGQSVVLRHWVWEDGTAGGPDAPEAAVSEAQVAEAQAAAQQQVRGAPCLTCMAEHPPSHIQMRCSRAARCPVTWSAAHRPAVLASPALWGGKPRVYVQVPQGVLHSHRPAGCNGDRLACAQADVVRELKAGGKSNSDPEVQAAVEELLRRKAAVERLETTVQQGQPEPHQQPQPAPDHEDS